MCIDDLVPTKDGDEQSELGESVLNVTLKQSKATIEPTLRTSFNKSLKDTRTVRESSKTRNASPTNTVEN